jgi:hypothetical protein
MKLSQDCGWRWILELAIIKILHIKHKLFEAEEKEKNSKRV